MQTVSTQVMLVQDIPRPNLSTYSMLHHLLDTIELNLPAQRQTKG